MLHSDKDCLQLFRLRSTFPQFLSAAFTAWLQSLPSRYLTGDDTAIFLHVCIPHLSRPNGPETRRYDKRRRRSENPGERLTHPAVSWSAVGTCRCVYKRRRSLSAITYTVVYISSRKLFLTSCLPFLVQCLACNPNRQKYFASRIAHSSRGAGVSSVALKQLL